MFPNEVKITRSKLDAGDYSIRSWEKYIGLERKGWPDYYSCCMGSERKYAAFRDQLTRLVELPFGCVVVEGVFSRTFSGFARGGRNDLDRLIYTTTDLLTEFGIPIIFAEKRSYAQDFAFKWLQRANQRAVRAWNLSSFPTLESSDTSDASKKQSLRKLTEYHPKNDPNTS